ncbi:protein SDA1 homolog [Watersipora subatra]|uniref:protein SDA1 homolog n=1 Tax=Watersipora subatra TaxID=2589382 RepID=UPI00355C4418
MTAKTFSRLPYNLPQLQNLIKRDPGSYKEEFQQQFRHYQSSVEIFQLNPSQFNKTLSELIMFLGQVSQCYKEELLDYPKELVGMLRRYSTQLDPEMRVGMCKTLILLRNRKLVEPLLVLELFFELFRCRDKTLRKFLYAYIVNDIKNVNSKHKDLRLNKVLQNFIFAMLRDSNSLAAKMSLDVMVELYRRDVWHDVKTVNVISTALFNKVPKISVAALKFFVGRDESNEQEDSDEDEETKKDHQETVDHLRLAQKVGKHSKKKEKRLKKVTKELSKLKKKKKSESFNFSALHLLHDPQDLAEKLFKHVEGLHEKFEVKLLYLNLVSRLIGVHELLVLNFYPYMQRFLKPHQRDVTKMLLYMAQASHALVPPEILESVLMTIANNFITERNSSEVMTVGLNAVREICARAPLCMTETLLQDLAQYKTNKDKGVHMAARSVIALFRALNPTMLHKKDRGKPTGIEPEGISEYADLTGKDHISGAEVLDPDDNGESEDDGWETDSEEEEDDGDGEWIDVNHSSDEEVQEEKDKLEKMTGEERVEKARAITQSRILTQEDFAKIKRAQLAKKAGIRERRGMKRKADKAISEEETTTEQGEILPYASIGFTHKKQKADKAGKMALAQEGKQDRGKYGHREHNPEAGVTNKVKKKQKNFQMVKHKLQKKSKRSFRDKQMSMKKSLLKRGRK